MEKLYTLEIIEKDDKLTVNETFSDTNRGFSDISKIIAVIEMRKLGLINKIINFNLEQEKPTVDLIKPQST
jgi:hypothetical protein